MHEQDSRVNCFGHEKKCVFSRRSPGLIEKERGKRWGAIGTAEAHLSFLLLVDTSWVKFSTLQSSNKMKLNIEFLTPSMYEWSGVLFNSANVSLDSVSFQVRKWDEPTAFQTAQAKSLVRFRDSARGWRISAGLTLALDERSY